MRLGERLGGGGRPSLPSQGVLTQDYHHLAREPL